jgi:hypothetical protein
VATTTWIALALSAFIPKLRWVAWAYWVAIFVGSIALGWHYFSDSVVGTAGAIVCWIVAGKVVAAGTVGIHRSALLAAIRSGRAGSGTGLFTKRKGDWT